MQTVLTIAGFDPSSGAGVTADLMVFAAHGLYGTACIAALTVQSTLGVQSSHATPAAVLEATLACLDVDIPPAGVKIGMLVNADNILVISRYIEILRGLHEQSSETLAYPLSSIPYSDLRPVGNCWTGLGSPLCENNCYLWSTG